MSEYLSPCELREYKLEHSQLAREMRPELEWFQSSKGETGGSHSVLVCIDRKGRPLWTKWNVKIDCTLTAKFQKGN